MSDIKQFCQAVTLEMTEMRKLGMQVPDGAFTRAADEEEMQDYINMKTSECADLLISLESIN